MAYSWPLPHNIPVSQNFGGNPASWQPGGHTGVDFACPTGTPLYAIGAGTVIFADWAQKLGVGNQYGINADPNVSRSAGIVVMIDHGPIISIYAHLDSTHLNAGQKVQAGQEIGKSGNTGFSTGPHLHFEILPDGWNLNTATVGRVNPFAYIAKQGNGGGASPIAKNQRVNGPSASNQRSEPNLKAKIVRQIPAGGLEVFDGFVRGERVSLGGVTSDVWYKDKVGYVWAGLFTSQSTDGLPDLTPKPALQSFQRRVGASVALYRDKPTRAGKIISEFAPNAVLDFKGFVRGEKVTSGGTTTDIWLVGKHSGGYVWAGGLNDGTKTTGLPDLTPKEVLQPNQRKVGGSAANQRTAPNTAAPITVKLDPGFVFTAKGWVKGESVSGNRIWFVGANSGQFIWSGACVDGSIGNLPDLTKELVEKAPVAPSPTPVAPQPPTVPVEPSKPVEKGSATDRMVKGELACVTRVLKAHTSNYQDYNFPTKPLKIVIHQTGTKGIHTHAGTLAWFQKPVEEKGGVVSSAHFVVNDEEIVQMVSLLDRAQHAGPIGNDFIGIETDPYQGKKTIENVRKLLGEIGEKYGYALEVVDHRSVPGNNTACGQDINLKNYVGYAKPKEKASDSKKELREIVARLTELIEKL